jgi:hypothetical protein
MKKRIILLALITIITAGTAFADHPTGKWGIGIMGRYGVGWGGIGYGGAALSLVVPKVPIFWGINLGFGENWFSTGISGDKYIIERPLIAEVKLHWFLGVGAYINLDAGNNYFGLEAGARLPIGISWHILDILEVFLNIAPSLGVSIIPHFYFPTGGFPAEIGLRFWL